MKLRIVSRLDIKGPNLVKGVNLEGLRILGKPQQFAKAYYDEGIDELIYVDTVASLYGRNSLLDLIRLTAKKIFQSLPKEFDAYFAHSYWLKSSTKNYVFTETKYNDVSFCSAIKKNNIIGFQFHPENSGSVGIQLLKNIFSN